MLMSCQFSRRGRLQLGNLLFGLIHARVLIFSLVVNKLIASSKFKMRTCASEAVGWNCQFFDNRKAHKGSSCRTRFSWRGRPSEDDLHRLSETISRAPGFNHDCVGMTNPILHSSNEKSTRPVPSTINNDNFWITDTFRRKEGAVSMERNELKWREIRIRKIVGSGRKCYETVRDAALSWERTLPVAVEVDPHGVTTRSSYKPFWAYIKLLNYNVLEDFGQRSTTSLPPQNQNKGCYKNVITISRAPIPFLNMWTYNPCHVIYELVDKRFNYSSPCMDCLGTTYTSTAYATVEGHLLSGEERVTVALHDAPSSKVEVEVLSYSRPTKSIFGRLVFRLIKSTQKRFFQDQVDTLVKVGQEVA